MCSVKSGLVVGYLWSLSRASNVSFLQCPGCIKTQCAVLDWAQHCMLSAGDMQAQQPSATAAGGAGARREHRIEIRAPQSLPAAQLQQEAQQPEPRPEGGWVGEPAVAAPSLAAVVAVPPALSPAPAGLGPAPVVGQEAAAGSTPAAGQQQQHAQQQQPGPNDDLETMLFEDI